MANDSQVFDPHTPTFRCSQCGVLNSIRLMSRHGTNAAAYYDFKFICGGCGAENEQNKKNPIPAVLIETNIGMPVNKAE